MAADSPLSGAGIQGLNRLMLIGFVGRRPEMRYTAHGVPVTTFSVAAERHWTDSDGERHEAVDWFNLVAWRHVAEICYERLAKDMLVYVEGRVQTRTWSDEDGNPRYETEVVVQNVIPLDGAGSDEDQGDEQVEAKEEEQDEEQDQD